MLYQLGLQAALVICLWLLIDLIGARGARSRRLPVMLLAVCTALWTLGELVILGAESPTQRAVGRHIIWTGGGILPIAWLWAGASLAQPTWYRRRPWLVALPAVFPPITFVLLFDQIRELFPGVEPFSHQAGGSVFWVQVAIHWALGALGTIHFLLAGVHLARAHGARMAAIVVGSTAPIIGNALYMTVGAGWYDPTPILLAFGGAAIRFAVIDSGLGAVLPLGQRAVVEQLRTGVVVADAAGHVVDANAAAHEILRSERLLGESLPRLIESLESDPDRRIDVEQVTLHRHLSGNVGFAALLTDRTDVDRLERQMVERQRLDSLGVLAAGIAHDFQNMMTGVLASAGLTRMALPASHPARRTLGDVISGAKAASRLTRQLLAYSGKGEFQSRPLDLSRELRKLAGLLSGSIPNDAVLDFQLVDGLPAVEADSSALDQVVMNLAFNAAEASDRGGIVRVRSYVSDLRSSDLDQMVAGHRAKPGSYVVLEVSDRGSGMSEETCERIFDPFFTTREGGHGFGLAATLGIVHRHGGVIAVESAPGEGSTFRVYLPSTEHVAEFEPVSQERDLHLAGSGVVLVVDDDDHIRHGVARALERMGYEVLSAEDGYEAIELFRARSDEIDVVLLDLIMPGMDGWATFTALGEIQPDARIIVSSSDEQLSAARKLEREGAAGLLRKPYDLNELFAVVKALSGRSAVRDRSAV